jgi:hypothetical protein
MALTPLEVEMLRRTHLDGIPRHIVNGKIMKYDWELSDDMDVEKLEGQALEDHIQTLIESQTDQ